MDCVGDRNVAKVEGVSSLLLEPDVIEFYFKVESSKDTADEARKSAAKRVEYLVQLVRNAKVKGERSVTVLERLNKRGESFEMISEVLVRCDTLQKYNELRNVAVEKLEGTVEVSEPRFSHSQKSLQDARTRVLRQAVSSARSKAVEMANASQQTAGGAVLLQELESTETGVPDLEKDFKSSQSWEAYPHSRLLSSKVLVVYELTNARPERQTSENASRHV